MKTNSVSMLALTLVTLSLATRTQAGELVAHWKFDEAGGAVAKDETGRHNGQMSPKGAGFVGGGVSGGALQLDRAANGFVTVPHVSALATNDVTLVVWVKAPAGASPT